MGEEGEQAALRCNGRRNPPQQVTENPAGNHQQEQAFDQPQKPPQQFVEQVKPRQLGHQIQSVAENEPEDQNAEETGQKQQRPGQKPSCRGSQRRSVADQRCRSRYSANRGARLASSGW